MDAEVGDRGGASKSKKQPNNWKLPKIPIDHVYKTKPLKIFPSYVIKDFEETLTLDFTQQGITSKSYSLVNTDFMNSFMKKQHKFLHLGLVQVAVKPLTRDGLGAPIIVCLRDHRLQDFKDSLLAIVETDVSNGPFYFNCFPSLIVPYSDEPNVDIISLSVKTSGIPIALIYRIVCKATVDLNSDALEELTLGRTTYFQMNSGSQKSTKWDEVQVPQEWITTSGFEGKTMMAAKAAHKEGDCSKIKNNKHDTWKMPKIPVSEVYKDQQPNKLSSTLHKLNPFPTTFIKDFKKTITLDSSTHDLKDQSFTLLNKDFINYFQRDHMYVHWGLVQVAIKPLIREGLKATIVVCLRDDRLLDFKASLLDLVETDLGNGPFYFNCFPSCVFACKDVRYFVLNLGVNTSDIPMALSVTYRVVCKASKNIHSLAHLEKRLIRGKTTYFQGSSKVPKTVEWESSV